MTFAIQHCLLHPDRASGVDAAMDFSQALQLEFAPPDFARFPCLQLAYEALRGGGSAPAIYNAANEIAVERFLNHEIAYLDIPRIIDYTLNQIGATPATELDALLEIDHQARAVARNFRST